MIEKNDIIAAARHILRRGQGTPDRRLIHPTRDWCIGVVCSGVLFVGGTAYAGYLFMELSGDRTMAASFDEPVAAYDQETVREVLEKYGKRQARFDALRADRSNAGALLGSGNENMEEENGTTTETGAEEERE